MIQRKDFIVVSKMGSHLEGFMQRTDMYFKRPPFTAFCTGQKQEHQLEDLVIIYVGGIMWAWERMDGNSESI